MLGDAHGPNATTWLNLHETESPAANLQHRNRVTTGVHCKQPLFVAAQDESALVSQPRAGPRATSRHGAGSNESTIGQAIEDEDRVAVGPVRHRVHGTRESKSQAAQALRILRGQRRSCNGHE